MPLETDTIAIPIVEGVNLNQEARLLDPPSLLEAINVRYSKGGAKKRHGYEAHTVRAPGNLPNPNYGTANWLWGWGHYAATLKRPAGTEDTLCGISDHPNAGPLSGTATRDRETLGWNGYRMYSLLPSQDGADLPDWSDVGNAVLPSLNAATIAKSSHRQFAPEVADTGRVKIVAWLDTSTSTPIACYSLYDSATNAPILICPVTGSIGSVTIPPGTAPSSQAFGIFPVSNPSLMRAFSLSGFLHVLVLDTTKAQLFLFTFNELTPLTLVSRSYGECETYFDVWKASETSAIIAKRNTSVIPHTIDCNWIQADGGGLPSETPFQLVPPACTKVGLISVCVAQNGSLGFAYIDNTTNSPLVSVLNTSSSGVAFSASAAITVPPLQPLRLTIAPKWLTTKTSVMAGADGYAIFDAYWDDGLDLYAHRAWIDGTQTATIGSRRIRYHHLVASHAFSIGDRTYLWSGRTSALQSQWFLLDEALNPIGHMDFGTANVLTDALYTGCTPSVNWDAVSAGTSTIGQIYKVYSGLGCRLRVPPSGTVDTTSTNIFTEPYIKEVRLDFLPPLRAAQAGRCTLFAGAQVWQYDGKELRESGFHMGPEPTTTLNTGGSLTQPGSYSYRVDLCHRNGQNEETRSLSIITPVVTTDASHKKITLTIPTVVTNRADSYFLIFRNAMEGGVPLTDFWLLNSRDPASTKYLANNQAVSQVTFVDDGTLFTDTTIQNNELHPQPVIQPLSAPACEVLSAGRDRIWTAGGELDFGVIQPSRLFPPGETPSFNPYLNIQVDRSAEPMTAIGFVGEVGLVFHRHSAYIFDSDGPDNNAVGTWASPRLAISDLGAVSQESLALITQGLVFQSPAGIRLIGPSGQLSPIGMRVDPRIQAMDIRGAVVIDADQEIRWVGENETIIYSYLYDSWGVWTTTGTGATRNADGRMVISRSDGTLWIEDPALFTDAGAAYTMRIRTPWLHGGNLGDFQRVRLISGMGTYADPDNAPAHKVRVELYYDEREFWEERFEWDMPDTSSNTDTWGAHNWGDGVWGDTSAVGHSLKDSTWEWVRRPSRQKCGVLSIAIDDNGTSGPGFVLTAIGLELRKKPGLNRIPERGGTSTYRK